MHVFRSHFRQEYKTMTLEDFLNFPSRTKFDNRKNAEALVNSVQSCRFGHSKRQNFAVFQDIKFIFCTFSFTSVLPYVFRFLESSKLFMKHFGNKKRLFFPKFQNFQKFPNPA